MFLDTEVAQSFLQKSPKCFCFRLGESAGNEVPRRKHEKISYPYPMDDFDMILSTPDIRAIDKLDYEHDRQKFLFLGDFFFKNSSSHLTHFNHN